MTGDQEPTFAYSAPSRSTDGPAAAVLSSAYLSEPLPWQRSVLDVMLARTDGDRFANPSVGLAVPRQNGKSEVVRARCLYGLVVLGERILYTCQNGDTADEMFQLFAGLFEDEANSELHPLLKAVRRANGQQAVHLAKRADGGEGGMIRFTTRTERLARGRSFDVLVYDEAQELTDGEQAASGPCITAAHLHNPQTIMLGTPPTPTTSGGVFRRAHDRAHAGDPRAPKAWLEWAVDEVGDVSDRSRWCRTNPSLGLIADEAALDGDLSMEPQEFAREHLGWWSPGAGAVVPAIDPSLWEVCATAEPSTEGAEACGVKFAYDDDRICVCMCRRGDPDYVELAFDEPASKGVGWLAGWLSERSSRIALVAVDGEGAGDLVQRLRSAGYPKRGVAKASPQNVRDAAAMLTASVNERSVLHWTDAGQAALDASVAGSPRRRIGDGFGFGGDDSAPVEAAALALWAARTTKRDPGRRMRVG